MSLRAQRCPVVSEAEEAGMVTDSSRPWESVSAPHCVLLSRCQTTRQSRHWQCRTPEGGVGAACCTLACRAIMRLRPETFREKVKTTGYIRLNSEYAGSPQIPAQVEHFHLQMHPVRGWCPPQLLSALRCLSKVGDRRGHCAGVGGGTGGNTKWECERGRDFPDYQIWFLVT